MKRELESFVTKAKDLTDALNDIKKKQALGSDSMVGYFVNSGNQNDYAVTVTYNQVRRFRLRFTYATARKKAILQLSFFYSINQPNVMSNYVPPWASGPLLQAHVEKQIPTDTYQDWIFSIHNQPFADNGTLTAYTKFFFAGTDTGTFTITEI